MENPPPYIKKAVRELLDKLVTDLDAYRWESLCTYAKEKGETVIELYIYRNGGQEMAARVAYLLETGEVRNVHYGGYEGDSPMSIIDLLLDMLNI
ncbi:MAG: hypothetical protein AAF570_10230 [Bacteroidota bacterium]